MSVRSPRSSTVLALMSGLIVVAAVVAGCGAPDAGTSRSASVKKSAGDSASLAPSAKPSSKKPTPTPSKTVEAAPTQSAAPTESAAPTPSDTGSDAPAPASDGGSLEPIWYPDWSPDSGKGAAQPWLALWPRPMVVGPTGSGDLDGKLVVIDPGHNVGNSTHSSKINTHYWVGLDKICNTTGTATASGYEEATYTFDVAKRLLARLTDAGATVVLTRDRNTTDTYGPCIQARGLLGGQVKADVEVSIHADGGPSSGRGAFVYTPGRLAGYTNASKATESVRLADRVLAGLSNQGLQGSTYLVPNVSPDTQQGTLNVATTPIAIVETLNMANESDAQIAESKSGRQQVADGLFEGIRTYLLGD